MINFQAHQKKIKNTHRKIDLEKQNMIKHDKFPSAPKK